MTTNEKFEYRAAWKDGVYDYFRHRPGRYLAVTLTTRDPWSSKDHLNERISRRMAAASCDGLVLVEEGRGDGRLHAHGVVADGIEAEDFLGEWEHKHGFVVRKPMSDLMGWITYMFKAFTSETPWTWKKGREHADSSEMGRGLRGSLRDASETETYQQKTLFDFEETTHHPAEG